MKIDPSRTWKKVEERLAVETDPVLRRNLEVVLVHMKAEAALDVDGLIETLSDRVSYHVYQDPEPFLNPKGKAEVRTFYETFAASGAHRLQFEVDRLVVDRDCVLTEGLMKIAYPGSVVLAMGHEIDDAEAYYLFQTHMAILWPIDEDGKILGEDTYAGADGFLGIAERKLTLKEIEDS